MTPHISWAFNQRDLTAAQRLVLIALCERANGERICFPSLTLIANDCELSRRAVAGAVHFLSAVRKLVSLVNDPAERARLLANAGGRHNCRANIYRINRPADPKDGAKPAPSHSAANAPSGHSNGAKPAPSKGRKGAKYAPSNGAADALMMVQNIPNDGAANAPESLHEINTEPLARVTRAADAAPDGRSVGALPVTPAPAKAPTLGATNAGTPANAVITPGQPPPDPFGEWLDKGAPASLATPKPERITEDDTPQTPEDRARMAEQLGGLAKSLARRWQNNYPPKASPLDVQEQIAVVLEPPRARAYFLDGEALKAARRAAGIPVPA